MTQDEKYMLESIYHSTQEILGNLALSPNLAQDTIDVTLNMAGYDIGAMSQFEKAHALMDMAMELKALATERKALQPYIDATFLEDYIRGK